VMDVWLLPKDAVALAVTDAASRTANVRGF
jgi:hypothetical protein